VLKDKVKFVSMTSEAEFIEVTIDELK